MATMPRRFSNPLFNHFLSTCPPPSALPLSWRNHSDSASGISASSRNRSFTVRGDMGSPIEGLRVKIFDASGALATLVRRQAR